MLKLAHLRSQQESEAESSREGRGKGGRRARRTDRLRVIDLILKETLEWREKEREREEIKRLNFCVKVCQSVPRPQFAVRHISEPRSTPSSFSQCDVGTPTSPLWPILLIPTSRSPPVRPDTKQMVPVPPTTTSAPPPLVRTAVKELQVPFLFRVE